MIQDYPKLPYYANYERYEGENIFHNKINKYLHDNIDENAIWDFYLINYEDDELTVYYHTWEGNGIVKEYIQHINKISYKEIIEYENNI